MTDHVHLYSLPPEVQGRSKDDAFLYSLQLLADMILKESIGMSVTVALSKAKVVDTSLNDGNCFCYC